MPWSFSFVAPCASRPHRTTLALTFLFRVWNEHNPVFSVFIMSIEYEAQYRVTYRSIAVCVCARS